MSLLQMSFSGAVMIMVVIVIRTLAINRLPKSTFLILWEIVLLRLMVPFSIPSAFSVYSLVEPNSTSSMLVQIPSDQRNPAESVGSRDIDNFDVSNMKQDGKTIFLSNDGARACLKNHSRHLHNDAYASYSPLCVIFAPNSGYIRHCPLCLCPYAPFIWHKSPTNCDAHLAESIFQTRSRGTADGIQEINDETEETSGSNVYKADSSDLNNKQNRFDYKTENDVTSDNKYRIEQKTDNSVILDERYSADRENDIDVILLQTLQKVIDYYQQFKPLCFIVWCVGVILCISYFTVSYLRCRFEFQISLPVENAYVQKWVTEHSCNHLSFTLPVKNALVRKWLEEHPHRLAAIRQSDRVSTPLTYGIFHPVILMPKNTDWENTKQLQYVLMHESVHICRYDALTKLLVTCALCIHWFNPMVWMMWFLFNRDVEISCDERVVRHMGEASKSSYALMLIQMEAERNGLVPFCSGLLSKWGNKAMEERITAIMKIRKKSMPAAIVAVVLVISVATAFATSAAETRNISTEKTDERSTEKVNHKTEAISDADFTEREYEMLLALKFDSYEDMSISEYRDKVWALTDTEEYTDIIDRFFQDETIYEMYASRKGTDNNETYDFLYNVLGPIMANQQTISFAGYAVTDFSSASDNASLEYTGTLTILDADQLTVGEYISARHHIEDDMENSLQGLLVSELRDEELMKIYIDETVLNITMTYRDNLMRTDIEYVYVPLNGVAVDDMEEWQKERRDEWDRMMEPYVPFGLTYNYDWDTDDYKMFFNGKEVRAIYDSVQSLWISEHSGIGEGIYDENAVDLYVVYEGRKIAGLREATAQEMAEADRKRFAATEAYRSGQEEEQRWVQELREEVPATEEDYQSLLTLKTPDYRSKSIADFDRELLDWANENYERMERIGYDNMLEDYHVSLTDEEKSFAAVTAHYSRIENIEYVRSLKKNEPEQAACESIRLPDKQGSGTECTLFYTFCYHISDKEKVSVGERDDCVGGMTDSIRSYWESTDIDTLMTKSESDMLEFLRAVAAKYSSQSIKITIVDDQTAFECLDGR